MSSRTSACDVRPMRAMTKAVSSLNLAAANPKPTMKKSASTSNLAAHPTCAQMVVQAVKTLNEKKGSSVHSIKRYILENFMVDVEESRMVAHFKKSLKTCVDKKELVQVTGIGASGSFKVGEAIKEKEKKAAAAEKSKEKKTVAAEKAKGKASTAPKKAKASPKAKTATGGDKKSSKAAPKGKVADTKIALTSEAKSPGKIKKASPMPVKVAEMKSPKKAVKKSPAARESPEKTGTAGPSKPKRGAKK